MSMYSPKELRVAAKIQEAVLNEDPKVVLEAIEIVREKQIKFFNAHPKNRPLVTMNDVMDTALEETRWE